MILPKLWFALLSGVVFLANLHSCSASDAVTSAEEKPSMTGPNITMDETMVRDMLDLLNAGKRMSGLKTENAEVMMGFVTSGIGESTSHSGSAEMLEQNEMEQMIEGSSNLRSEPDEEKVFNFSLDKNGTLHLDRNESAEIRDVDVVTDKLNETEVHDIFEMILEKDIPAHSGKSRKVERIEIAETEELEPLPENQFTPRKNRDSKKKRRRRRKRELGRFPGSSSVQASPTSHVPEPTDSPEQKVPEKEDKLALPLFIVALLLMLVIFVIGLIFVCKTPAEPKDKNKKSSDNLKTRDKVTLGTSESSVDERKSLINPTTGTGDNSEVGVDIEDDRNSDFDDQYSYDYDHLQLTGNPRCSNFSFY